MDFNEELQRDRDEAETACAEQAADDIGIGEGVGLWGPDEEEVAQRDEGHGGFRVDEVELVLVDEGRRDGGGDEADYYQKGTGDAGVGLGVAVGLEDLVEEGGEGVEEADVDAEGESDEEEFGGVEEGGEGVTESVGGGVGEDGG